MFYDLLLVIGGLVLSTYLFYKASGTLKLTKLNLISYMFYIFILQTYIGVSLIYLGDTKSYMTKYILNTDTIEKTFFFVLFSAIVIPLTMILVQRFLKIDVKVQYDSYLKAKTTFQDENGIFIVITFIFVICFISLVIMLNKIGYIPLLKIVFRSKNLNLQTERIRITNSLPLNQYIKNILVLTFIPLLSYVTFVYAYIKREKKWIILFSLIFMSSILVKTYNFAKTPVVFYLFTYIVIYILINNGIKRAYFLISIILFGAIIVGMYMVNGLTTSVFEIHRGPIGRVLFTQAGTLMYHFDLFPSVVSFLKGRSFSNIIIKILGIKGSSVRSAKIAMDFYGSHSVFAGTAGVMNAFFIGEAYANFGKYGAILSVIYVGALFSAIYVIFLKLKKDAINITLFAVLTCTLVSTTQGGFFDFIYNFNILITILLLVFIKYAGRYVNKKFSNHKLFKLFNS